MLISRISKEFNSNVKTIIESEIEMYIEHRVFLRKGITENQKG